MKTPRQRLFLFLPGLVLALLLAARVVVHAREPVPPPIAVPTATALAAAPKASLAGAGPEVVTVGLYLQNVPEIDIKTNSFTAEFYLWFLWKGDIDPTISFQLSNTVNELDLTRVPVFVDEHGNAKPDALPDGRLYQQYHVYGRFGHPFPLERYPFDDHEIVISLEDVRYSDVRLVHQIDAKGSAMRPDLSIPGWILSPLTTVAERSRFATTFGDPRVESADEAYSRVDFKVHIARPVVGIVSKTVIPIAIIILITFGAFYCEPSDMGARLSLTITALISAVASQFTAAAELPPTGSLLLLDKLYILSYLAILTVTFCCIAANRAVHRARPELAQRIDRLGLVLSAIGYFTGLAFFMTGAR